jgi:2',3'-cyclic-nucleotide 2'-phosphodiesterase (5'-nucleotidase family)
MRAKFAGAMHPVLCANWKDKNGAQVFEPSHVWTVNGVRVAAFGVMVPIVTDRMTTRAASNYLWDQPVPCAVEVAGALRKKADVVVALTHIGIAQDRRLAEATSDIDVIFGGHSHTVIEAPEVVNGVAICQGGSHAQFVGRYVIEPGKGVTKAELLPWP